jgi:MraZ protein
MLRGSHTAKIDDKGRIKIPAGFKRYLDEKYGRPDFYVTSLNGHCARVYPLSEWEEIENELMRKPPTDPSRQKFLDHTSYFGQMQQVDAQGRVLIHPLLRNEAGLQGDVTVIGYLTYLEVWNAERFRRSRIEEQQFTNDDAVAMARYTHEIQGAR